MIEHTSHNNHFIEFQKEFTKEYHSFRDRKLEEYASNALFPAVSYVMQNPSKLIRAQISFLCMQQAGFSKNQSLHMAYIVELVHSYSLVHDDLPSMDNALLRRGQPTLHCVYNEAIAVLAGDALLTLAFEELALLCMNIDQSDTKKPRGFSTASCMGFQAYLSKSVGMEGMILGQVLDIANQDHDVATDASKPRKTIGSVVKHQDELVRVAYLKTGCLLSVCFASGAMLAGENPKIIKIWQEIGKNLGIVYQMLDDSLDMESSHDTGKDTALDQEHGKTTFAAYYENGDALRAAAKARMETMLRSLEDSGAFPLLGQLCQSIFDKKLYQIYNE